MVRISTHKRFFHKFTAFCLSICLSGVFAPAVWAEGDDGFIDADDYFSSGDSSQSSDDSSTSSFTPTANSGFENVESDGGTMLVGTARIPRADGSPAAVKFIYSDGINLNDKSLKLINTELSALGVTIPNGMIYVSHSDYVSDSSLVTETSERQAVFACGSLEAPTVLKAYPAYRSVEESFEYLYRGYVYSISEYNSLAGVLADREEITLSEDGKSAYTSIVMSEDYVEKTINGKKVKILMINSELKYCFRAPKLVYVKDDSYNVASNSDIVYHYGTTTQPTAGTSEIPTLPTDASSEPSSDTSSSDEYIVSPDGEDTKTTTEPIIDDTTTDDFEELPTTASTTESTTKKTTASTTASTTATTTTTRTTTTTIDEDELIVTNPPAPTTTTTTASDDDFISNVTRANSNIGSGQRGIVNTRRLSLNMRSGPGMKYMIVTVLPKGTYVTVLDTSNPDWYMVKTMGNVVGYCYSGYIKIL